MLAPLCASLKVGLARIRACRLGRRAPALARSMHLMCSSPGWTWDITAKGGSDETCFNYMTVSFMCSVESPLRPGIRDRKLIARRLPQDS
ncbi:hypothetical protein LshimejAT787_1100670 [Lyophyllum shimeji]|uniref:Uncharacterized protein n=1 Tax=Lyophyllum shimeji TaxID=47721 RepID=A0A9P3PSN7_LYOSH|nr:hypothetical protein LshimejAT787_1100670 [Lyophyllum shimeji]